jgi:hypothetical protein
MQLCEARRVEACLNPRRSPDARGTFTCLGSQAGIMALTCSQLQHAHSHLQRQFRRKNMIISPTGDPMACNGRSIHPQTAS